MQALKVWSPLVISFSDFPDGRAAFWLSNPRPRQCNEVKAMFTTATVLPLPTISSFNEFSWSPCTLISPLLPFFPPLLLSASPLLLKSRWTFFRPRWIPGGMASSSKLDSMRFSLNHPGTSLKRRGWSYTLNRVLEIFWHSNIRSFAR